MIASDGPFSASTPALVALNDTLYLVYIANDGTNRLYMTSSKDGIKWTSESPLNKVTPVTPALAAWKNNIVMVFTANNSRNDLLFAFATV